MSFLHVQRLLVIAEDYAAVRQAVVRSLKDTNLVGYAALSRAEGSLETSYIARLFSKLEAILRWYLQANDPRSYLLLRPAQLSPSQTRAAISFSDTRSILRKSLARLP